MVLTSTNPDTLYSTVAVLNNVEDTTELPENKQQVTSDSAHVPGSFHYQSRWARFRGKDRDHVGIYESLKAIALSSWLNLFLILIPLAWASHFVGESKIVTFTLCFLAIIPLERLFEFCGEQMALYCGKAVGDLITVSLNNTVEATLAIILLTKCELKLLQSTVAGVVLLHLLLVPGMAFLTGGARIWHQDLHPLSNELNHSLLTIGVFSLLVPAALFSAVNPGYAITMNEAAVLNTEGAAGAERMKALFLSDTLRADLLSISRGISVILLVVYVASRFYLHKPPGGRSAFESQLDIPEEIDRLEKQLALEEPKVNHWVCVFMLVFTVGIMAVTAEWLVSSIQPIREKSYITGEFFGIFLLPLVSFSGDAAVAITYFIKSAFSPNTEPPTTLAKGQAIDLSIQFTLFWMPFFVLLAWCLDKPLSLLFDLYEVSIMIGACFLVNYVTADSKTNWAEGLMLCAFYFMIALASWYYGGQIEIDELLQCRDVTQTLMNVTAVASQADNYSY